MFYKIATPIYFLICCFYAARLTHGLLFGFGSVTQMWVIPLCLLIWALNFKGVIYGLHRQTQKNNRNSSTDESTGTTGERASTYDSRASKRACPRIGIFQNRLSLYGRLPRAKDDMPILAKRAADLRYLSPNSIEFVSLNTLAFGVDDDAHCNIRPHKAPNAHCSCGFYAVPNDVNTWGGDYTGVKLLVELSGVVIEHSEGYRASHQRVVEVQVPKCLYNQRHHSSEYVVFRGGTCHGICEFCLNVYAKREPGRFIKFDHLENVLGVRVVSQ